MKNKGPQFMGRVALEVRLISFQESKIELILFRQQLYQKSAVEFTAKISVTNFLDENYIIFPGPWA